MTGSSRGELREEREEELPICSLEERRFNCANKSTQAAGSPVSPGRGSSSREEFEPLKRIPFCWSKPGGETRGETGVTLRLFLGRTGDCRNGEAQGERSEPVGEGQEGFGLQGGCRRGWEAVGLWQGLLRMSLVDDAPFTFFNLERFSRFFDFGEGVLVLSTECDLFRRLVLPDLASRSTVHQLLLPEFSFCIFTNRLCSERLCLTEFYRKERES